MSPAIREQQSPTQADPCAKACVCAGRLTSEDCNLRSDLLWAAILAEPGTPRTVA